MQKAVQEGKIQYHCRAYLGIEETLAAIMIKKNLRKLLVIYTLDAMTGRTSPVLFGSKSLARKSIERWESMYIKRIPSAL